MCRVSVYASSCLEFSFKVVMHFRQNVSLHGLDVLKTCSDRRCQDAVIGRHKSDISLKSYRLLDVALFD